MAADVALTYEGPQALIVELGREVLHGDVIHVPAELADKICQSGGFRKASSGEAKKAKTAATKAEGGGVAKEPTAKDVVASVPDLTDEELVALSQAEQERSKPRKSVVEAVEGEQAARAEATAPPEAESTEPPAEEASS
jgi:hypothetical protein